MLDRMLRTALRDLTRSPLRSCLAVLGIVIGVASVVTVLSIGRGARIRIEEALAAPEARVLELSVSTPRDTLRGGNIKLAPYDRLTLADYDAIAADIPNTVSASPRISTFSSRAQAHNRQVEFSLQGIDVNGLSLLSQTVVAGAMFDSWQVKSAANVCLISESIASVLYGENGGVGETLRISRTPFKVIGVVADAPTPDGRDFRISVPFTTLVRRISSDAPMSIMVEAADLEHVFGVRQDVYELMERRRGKRRSEFFVGTALDSIQRHADGSRSVTRLLAAVGAISLVVGGIGVMNIMLTTVTERTREIGLRIAVGTRASEIRRLFLVESAVLTALGGFGGMILGVSVSYLIAQLNQWPNGTTPAALVGAFACSAGVGLFFGYHPATRAAALDPVQSLHAD